MDWNEYQEIVADVFREIGAEVKTNYKVTGARGEHNIDVWIKLKKFGVAMIWICECKYWQSSIPKEKVLTLYEITKDIGADRGFLFSESGFQSGAIQSSQNTNITLTSVDEICELIDDELQEIRLLNFAKRIEEIRDILKSTWIDDMGNPILNSNPGFDKCLTIEGTLMYTSLQIQKAINNNFPVYISRYSMENIRCNNKEELNSILQDELKSLEPIIKEIKNEFEEKTIEIEKLIDTFTKSILNLLASSEKHLFKAGVNIEEQIMETANQMKLVGKDADNLKKLTTGTLWKQVHKMMRILIEFIYPHLTKEEMDIREWNDSKKMVLNQINVLKN